MLTRTPDAQELRYLDATIRLFQERFPEHPNVANDQGLRYLRQNLMQSVEYVGSAKRLYKVWSRVCGDTTQRGLQTIAAFAESRNLANYLLGGLKRDLLSRYSEDHSEEAVAPSRNKRSAFVNDGGQENEGNEEDNNDSVYAAYGKRKLDPEDDPDNGQEVLFDADGDPIIFDEDGERIPPPGYDPNAEIDPEDDPNYDPDEILYDPNGEPIIVDEHGERIPPPGYDPDAELDPEDDPNYDPDWDNH
jgi:hypothetical protein